MGRAFQNILRAFAQAELRPLFTTSFIMQGGFAFYMTFASVYLLTHFGFTEQSIGNYFAYVGIWIVMTQLFVTRLLSGRLSEKSILTISIIGMGLSIWGIVLAPNATYLYVVIPFFAIATGLSQSNLTGLLSRTASPSIQGEVLGLNSSVNALAIAIPPLFSGIIASFLSAAAPLVVAGGIIICAGLYFTISVRARL
jgi:predicted MFS family arabinose efflux permease